MEHKQLRYFVTLAEELHFGRAAKRLNITQPPLSISIKALEDDLGVRLLERGGRQGISLTAAGITLLRDAKHILEESRRARRNVQIAASGAAGSLNIGYTDDFIYGLLPQLIYQYSKQYPQVSTGFFLGYTEPMAEQLNTSELDCIFTAQPTHLALAEHNKMLWKPVPIVALVSDQHKLKARKKVKPGELRHDRLLTEPQAGRTTFESQMAKLIVKGNLQTQNTIDALSPLIGIEMIRHNHGITMSTLDAVPPHLPGITILKIDDPDACLDRILVWRDDNTNPALTHFLSLGKEVCDRY